MATPITVIGNVTSQPELRYSNAGKAWVTFSVAHNNWAKNPQTGEVTESTDFYDCKMFGEHAENFAASCEKGTRVIITGTLKQDSWTDQASGQKRSKFVVYVDEVGPSLRWARTPGIERISSNGGGSTRQYNQPAASVPAGAPEMGAEDNPFM
jgi:single-strand DNA-binding protein